ncbi:hypothetical protein GQ457_02G024710 [Hibiscus cannabinus]
MSVGTEITYGDSMLPDNGWVEILNRKWDRNVVTEETSKFIELKLQVETEQRPHKVSFYVDKNRAQAVMKELSDCLEKSGLHVKIFYSGGMDLDILPQGAGNGQALAYLLNKFKTEGIPPVNTLVCGDSGNDVELFSIPDVYGVMVNNAQEELLQWHAENAKGNPNIIHAKERCAAEIREAIGHFNLGSNSSPRDVAYFVECKVDHVNPSFEVVKFYLFYERWRRGEADNCESYLAIPRINSVIFLRIRLPLSGVEKTLRECIHTLKGCYGDQKGKQFQVWVDRVLSTPVGSSTWLVKFDKWELSGNERCCCVTTAKINAKKEGRNRVKVEDLKPKRIKGYLEYKFSQKSPALLKANPRGPRLELGPEIEKTQKQLKRSILDLMNVNRNNGQQPADGQELRARADGAIAPPAQQMNQQLPARTVRDYLAEDLEGLNPAVTMLDFKAEHFELKPVMFNMLNTLGQFGGTPNENARQHG